MHPATDRIPAHYLYLHTKEDTQKGSIEHKAVTQYCQTKKPSGTEADMKCIPEPQLGRKITRESLGGLPSPLLAGAP